MRFKVESTRAKLLARATESLLEPTQAQLRRAHRSGSGISWPAQYVHCTMARTKLPSGVSSVCKYALFCLLPGPEVLSFVAAAVGWGIDHLAGY